MTRTPPEGTTATWFGHIKCTNCEQPGDLRVWFHTGPPRSVWALCGVCGLAYRLDAEDRERNTSPA